MIYSNGKVFIGGEFVNADIHTDGDIITDIVLSEGRSHEGKKNAPESAPEPATESAVKSATDSVTDCSDKYIIPGLVDIHTHGCVGYDFSIADFKMLSDMTEYYYKSGISAVLATTMTNPRKDLFASAEECAKYISAQEKLPTGHASIAGIYMEGPFFGPKKKGAHDEKYLMPLDENYLNDYDKECDNNIKVVAFDPLLFGSDDFVKKYRDKYVLSIAHTTCDYDRAVELMEGGVLHVTHLFNAMDGFDKRNPGIVGAVLDKPSCYAELICDGIHIHPSVIRAMFRQHSDHIVIISDSMSATGLSDGVYTLGGQEVFVNNHKAVLKDGTIAGSATNLFEMMKKVISYGVSLEEAVAAVTVNPAKSVGIDDRFGVIAVGRKADFVVMDGEYNIINR